MTYEVRTPTIALDEHELRSLRGWLNQMASVNGKDIWLQRAPSDFTRPAFVLKEVDRNVVDRGRSFTMDETDWQLEILTDDFWEMKQITAEIRQRCLQSSRVPLYLYGWQYPDIYIEELPSQGSLPAGEVSVGVSAVNHEDEESLLSSTVQITVALNSAVRVSWTPWPRAVPVAKEYRVYAGATGAEQLQVTVPDPGKRLNVFTDLASVGAGASPPSSSVFFANRYLRIVPAETSTRSMEHPAADGVFNGYVNFRTRVESVRIARPGAAALEQEIATVTQTLEVGT